jgi:hypothetical protein
MHLNTQVALDLIERRLHQDEEAFWTRHMEICRDCAQGVSQLRQLEVDLKRSHLKNAPQHDLDNAVRIFQATPQKVPSTIPSVVATIIFDSFIQPSMVGLRGSSSLARQIVMRAEDFDIHVKIWGDEDRKQMLGQLLPRKGREFMGGARFHLLRNGERLESTVTDETGEFHFTDVPQGPLSIQIDLPHLTVIGALNLQDA